MNVRPVRADLFHADGQKDVDRQTDMKMLVASFRKFAKTKFKYVSFREVSFTFIT